MIFEGSVYEFFAKEKSWHDAEAACVALGGHLASISSKEENAMVFRTNEDPLASRWLGGFKDRTTSPVSFPWTDGTTYIDLRSEFEPCRPARDCLFRKNEPNDEGGNEDCLGMGSPVSELSPMGWNDADCTIGKAYVCETPGEPCRSQCPLTQPFSCLPK